MTSLSTEARAAADRNFAEKLAARKDGRAPVLVTPAAGASATSQEAVDARFRAKMANHGKAPAPEPKGDKSKGKAEEGAAPAVSTETKPKGDKSKG